MNRFYVFREVRICLRVFADEKAEAGNWQVVYQKEIQGLPDGDQVSGTTS